MSVYKTPKSPYWQYDFQRKGRRFHGSTGCTRKIDAERHEAELKRRAVLGQETKPGITVDEACGTWWAAVGAEEKNHATTRYQLNNLIVGLGANVLLADISHPALDLYVAKRRAKVANASVNRETEIARRVWRYARDHEFDVPDIDWGKLMLKEAQERVRELTAGEEKALFEQLPPDLAALVEFALLSGQRRSAVVTMLWKDVDLQGMRATVRTKGGGKRKGPKLHTFPLTPRMAAIIANRPKVCAQVFTYECERPSPPRQDRPRRLKGERYPFSAQGWMRKWRKALTDADIEDFRFHDIRHTAGTRVLRATGNLKVVQKLLGHVDVKTTARYAHAMEDDVRDALLAAESRNSPGRAVDAAAENSVNSSVKKVMG